MKNTLSILFCLFFTASLAVAGDLPTSMQGTWSLKRTNDDGDSVVQKLIFKKNSFQFRIMSEGGSTLIYAEGKAQVTTSGKLKIVVLTDMKAGQSESEAEFVDMEYQAPIRISYKTMYLASGLDEEREEEPRVDAYRKK